MEKKWTNARTKNNINIYLCVIYYGDYPHYGYINPQRGCPGLAQLYIPNDVWPLKLPGSYPLTDFEMGQIGQLNIGLDNNIIKNNLNADKINSSGKFEVSEYNFPLCGEKGIMISNDFSSEKSHSILSSLKKSKHVHFISQERSLRGFAADFREVTGLIIEPLEVSKLEITKGGVIPK